MGARRFGAFQALLSAPERRPVKAAGRMAASRDGDGSFAASSQAGRFTLYVFLPEQSGYGDKRTA
ncbi:hypothetical protein KL86PLE_100537 [uncultured Pleomorphomonas sp.]|uniref:Uncharacterized protein n=1 Tax=uncultured Pleomorphomonas sp. TaxID=442121 RepID=A0A212L4L5_9HYPH|nr:hypothetical protein KL86PLE_100537 [uncultured Pleomorphomonas sp.]